jgi:peptidyl-dipeptidase Dcp
MTETLTNDITIRTELRSGDMGYVIHRHGVLYTREYGFGTSFEKYVAAGFIEFYDRYDPSRDRVWVCEHNDRIVGFLLLMHRDEAEAQLRYFYLEPEYRGKGLGKKLIDLFMQFLEERHYTSAYLWTTHELDAAAALYRSAGFVLAEKTESKSFGKSLVEHKYEWKVG